MATGAILGKRHTYTPENLRDLTRDDLALILVEDFHWPDGELRRGTGGRHRLTRYALRRIVTLETEARA